jgi:hypothetical protein
MARCSTFSLSKKTSLTFLETSLELEEVGGSKLVPTERMAALDEERCKQH